MNFLAHLLTGDSSDEMLVGSFAGDFCKGSLDGHPEELRAGIRLHRMVDAFAEGHPSFSRVRAILRPSLGLYAPVGADMLIDHLLARDWNEWVSGEDLAEFARRAGVVLLGRAALLPENGARIATMMVRGGWLESYAREDGIRTALERMTMRTRGTVRLSDAMGELDRHGEAIAEAGRDFLGDLFSNRSMIAAGMRSDLPGRARKGTR